MTTPSSSTASTLIDDTDPVDQKIAEFFELPEQQKSVKNFVACNHDFVMTYNSSNYKRNIICSFNNYAKINNITTVSDQPNWNVIRLQRGNQRASRSSSSSPSSTRTQSRKRSRVLTNSSIHNWVIRNRNATKTFNNILLGNNFFYYQLAAQAHLKNKIFNMQLDISELMALSGILYLPKNRLYDAVINRFIPSTTLDDLRNSVVANYGQCCETSVVPQEVKYAIKKILMDYKEDQDEYKAMMSLYALSLSVNNRKIYFIIAFIITLITEVESKGVNIGESRLQGSFIHPFIKAITKYNKKIKPYISNLAATKANDELTWRPDYLVEAYRYLINEYATIPILYGEIKPEGIPNAMIEKDKYKLGVYTQLALGEYDLENGFSFMDIHDEVTFFVQTQFDEEMTLFVELDMVKLYIYDDDLVKIVDSMDDMLKVATIFGTHALKKNEEPSRVAPVFPLGAFKRLTGEIKEDDEDFPAAKRIRVDAPPAPPSPSPSS